MAQVFDYTDYRRYLADALDERSKSERGSRSRLAEALGCAPSYLTQVLKGACDISLEQGDRVNRYVGHTDEQCEYFLLLINYARAGTEGLRSQLKKQLERQQRLFRTLNHRIKTKNQLSPESRQVYYSHWLYAAVTIALTIPALQSKEALSAHFKLPLKKISEVLEFLVSSGLANHKAGSYKPGTAWIYLGDQPELAVKDHVNWRLKVIQSFETMTTQDLHYSSVVSLSRDDFLLIKARLIQAVEDSRSVIKESKEEVICGLLLDFFEV